jgi:hypothetical protein
MHDLTYTNKKTCKRLESFSLSKKNDNNNNISPNQITQFGILATIIGSLLCSTSYIDLSMSLLSTWAAGTRRTRSVKPSTISWLKGVRLQVTKQGKFHGFGPQIWGYIYICICMYIYIILYIYILYIYVWCIHVLNFQNPQQCVCIRHIYTYPIQQQPPEEWILSRNLNWQKFGCDPQIFGYHQQRWNINPLLSGIWPTKRGRAGSPSKNGNTKTLKQQDTMGMSISKWQ